MLLDRWHRPWHWLFYGTLATSTAIALAAGDAGARRGAIVALAAALGVWYWRAVARQACLSGSLAWVVGNLGLAAALWVPLLLWNAIFLLLMFSAYGVACSLPARRAIPAIAAVGVLIVATTSVREASFDELQALLFAVVTVAFSLLVLGVRALERQSEQRRQLLAELEATREELAASERQSGALAERERLSREIHDTLAQGFASIVTLYEAARADPDSPRATLLRRFDEAAHTARQNLEEARRLVWALRPGALERHSLSTAIVQLAERFERRSGIPVQATVTEPGNELPALIETALLRVAQEALANVHQHAEAGKVALTLSYSDDAVMLDVRDDGVGFERGATQATNGREMGFGLSGMEERVQSCGGGLTIESAHGQGTAVSASIPLRTAETPLDRSGTHSGPARPAAR